MNSTDVFNYSAADNKFTFLKDAVFQNGLYGLEIYNNLYTPTASNSNMRFTDFFFNDYLTFDFTN